MTKFRRFVPLLLQFEELVWSSSCIIYHLFILSISWAHQYLGRKFHYSDVIMTAMASQITNFTIDYPSVYSSADQRKYQSSASLAFVRGIHRWPVNYPHKGPVTREMFPFDDVFMERMGARFLKVTYFLLLCRSEAICYEFQSLGLYEVLTSGDNTAQHCAATGCKSHITYQIWLQNVGLHHLRQTKRMRYLVAHRRKWQFV